MPFTTTRGTSTTRAFAKLAAKGGVIHVNAYSGYLIPVPKIPQRDAEMAALDKHFGEYSKLSPAQIQQWRRDQAEIDRKYPVPRANLDDYMRHLLHILKVAGPEHVGIGADWDGGGGVTGLEDVSALPKITERLLAAGYSERDVRNIWGGNLLRAIRVVQTAAENGVGKIQLKTVTCMQAVDSRCSASETMELFSCLAVQLRDC